MGSIILETTTRGVNPLKYFLFQNSCNQMQRSLSGRVCRAAIAAITADFQACHNDVETAVALNLSLEPVE
jgi:hypothetical protein